MRVPALQTLLLYAKSLDTNEDCTRILCDEWLEIKFLDAELAQKIVSAVLYLRSSIEKLFKIRLEDRLKVFDARLEESDAKNDEFERDRDDSKYSRESSSSAGNFKERAKTLERLLKKKLSEFLDSSILYSLRRVLPAEVATIYVRSFKSDSTVSSSEKKESKILNPKLKEELSKHSESKAKANETKGGYRITDYLTYNW
jgi:hypothetical protein